jgi:hypothetical protein
MRGIDFTESPPFLRRDGIRTGHRPRAELKRFPRQPGHLLHKVGKLDRASRHRLLADSVNERQQDGGEARDMLVCPFPVNLILRTHKTAPCSVEIRIAHKKDRRYELHVGSRALDGLPDSRVGATAADIVNGVNIGIGRIRSSIQQGDRGHDLPWLAVAALGDIVVNPGLLDGVEIVANGEALNGGNGSALDFGNGYHTRVDGLTINMAGAGFTDIDATAVFGSIDAKFVAEDPEQG